VRTHTRTHTHTHTHTHITFLNNLSIQFLAITKKDKTHKCLFIIKSKDGSSRCGLQFKSANQLKEHRQQVGHQKKKKKQKEATQLQESEDDVAADHNGDADKCTICTLFS